MNNEKFYLIVKEFSLDIEEDKKEKASCFNFDTQSKLKELSLDEQWMIKIKLMKIKCEIKERLIKVGEALSANGIKDIRLILYNPDKDNFVCVYGNDRMIIEHNDGHIDNNYLGEEFDHNSVIFYNTLMNDARSNIQQLYRSAKNENEFIFFLGLLSADGEIEYMSLLDELIRYTYNSQYNIPLENEYMEILKDILLIMDENNRDIVNIRINYIFENYQIYRNQGDNSNSSSDTKTSKEDTEEMLGIQVNIIDSNNTNSDEYKDDDQQSNDICPILSSLSILTFIYF